MIDREQPAFGLHLIEDRIECGRTRAAELEVHEGCGAEEIGVAVEGGDLAIGGRARRGGHVRRDRLGKTEVELYGIVANNAGEVFAGRFIKGGSPVCITIEVMVQEWLD